MKSEDANTFFRIGSLAIGLTGLFGIAGCAIGGAGNAMAVNSVAKGGDARSDARVSLTLALGDKVAQAAADLARSIISPLGGNVSEPQKQEAIERGVQRGMEEAAREGKQVTPQQQADLQKHVTQAVESQVGAQKAQAAQAAP